MRAKRVKYYNQFDRSRGFRSTLGIGGSDPGKWLETRILEDWNSFLDFFKSLKGKTISGDFNLVERGPHNAYVKSNKQGYFTITIKEIYNDSIEIIGPNNISLKVFIKCVENDNIYIYTGGKIYIEK